MQAHGSALLKMQDVRVALDAVTLASRAAAEMQSRAVTSVQKNDASPVTVADFTVQALILSRLASAFPGDRFIAEESSVELLSSGAAVINAVVDAVCEFGGGAPTAASVCAALDLGGTGAVDGWSATSRTWVLDPIDGTKGFVRGDQFAVALALLEEGQPVLGLLGCPKADRPLAGGSIFWAKRGHGAFRRPVGEAADGLAQDVRIRVDPLTDPERVVSTEAAEATHTSFGRSGAALGKLGFDVAKPIRIDGQGKYGLVACGEAHVYMRLPREGCSATLAHAHPSHDPPNPPTQYPPNPPTQPIPQPHPSPVPQPHPSPKPHTPLSLLIDCSSYATQVR